MEDNYILFLNKLLREFEKSRNNFENYVSLFEHIRNMITEYFLKKNLDEKQEEFKIELLAGISLFLEDGFAIKNSVTKSNFSDIVYTSFIAKILKEINRFN